MATPLPFFSSPSLPQTHQLPHLLLRSPHLSLPTKSGHGSPLLWPCSSSPLQLAEGCECRGWAASCRLGEVGHAPGQENGFHGWWDYPAWELRSRQCLRRWPPHWPWRCRLQYHCNLLISFNLYVNVLRVLWKPPLTTGIGWRIWNNIMEAFRVFFFQNFFLYLYCEFEEMKVRKFCKQLH